MQTVLLILHFFTRLLHDLYTKSTVNILLRPIYVHQLTQRPRQPAYIYTALRLQSAVLVIFALCVRKKYEVFASCRKFGRKKTRNLLDRRGRESEPALGMCEVCGRTGPPILRGRQILDELLLLAQICTKSFVGWGFAPDPTGGAYSAPPDPLAGFKGPTSKGRGGKGGRGGGRGAKVLSCPRALITPAPPLPQHSVNCLIAHHIQHHYHQKLWTLANVSMSASRSYLY